MNSKDNIKYHILIFKILGLWPSENDSIGYKMWTYIYCILFCFGCPASHLICVFYVESMNAIVDNLVLTSSIIIASMKAINVLLQKRKFVQLSATLKQMDYEISDPISQEKIKKITKQSHMIFFVFLSIYWSAWTNVVMQVLSASPEERIWLSTYLIPNEFLNQPNIYLGVLIYQAVANFTLCTLDVPLDTYGAILLHTLAGHVDALGHRLQKLGNDKINQLSSAANKRELVHICKNYVNLLM